jgi:hypothetical protein
VISVGELGWILVAGLGVGLMAYLFGAFSFSRNLWPIGYLRNVKQLIKPGIYSNTAQLNAEVVFDQFGRLASYPGKIEIPCPGQTEGTAVLLLIGQSNAANTGGQRHASAHGDKVLNYFSGKCFIAASPLLGASDKRGDAWTLLGNKLVDSGLADRVILVSAAVGGTLISRWKAGGDLNRMLLEVIDEVSPRLRITHVLWHQGEEDFLAATSQSDYSGMFHSMVESIRSRGIDAPVFPSIATKCGIHPGWNLENPVANAQRALADPRKNIYPGIDTDRLLGSDDRYDDCHLAASGQEKFADAWAALLKSRRQLGS